MVRASTCWLIDHQRVPALVPQLDHLQPVLELDLVIVRPEDVSFEPFAHALPFARDNDDGEVWHLAVGTPQLFGCRRWKL